MIAINDGFIIEACVYKLLKRNFRYHAAYVDFVELFHDTTFQTVLGQMMDLITAPVGDIDLSRFSDHKYRYIVEFKNQFNSHSLGCNILKRCGLYQQ